MTFNLRRALLALLTISLSLLLPNSAWAKTTVASIFTDTLVLQRDMLVPIWGWAAPGEAVTVSFAGQEKTATAEADGRWMVKLDPLKANTTPAEMTIHGADTITIHNILIGEVWLCGGQSNMALELSGCFNAKEEIAAANYPLIRFVAAPAGGNPFPVSQRGPTPWKVCTPENTAGFAGVAYFMGRSLHQKLNVPIGLVEFAIGATGIEGWVPLTGFENGSDPLLQNTYHEVVSWNPASEIGKKAHEEAFEKIRRWLPLAQAALRDHQPVPPEPLLPAAPTHQNGPTTLFNATVNPLVPYAVRGAAWYQGEANPGEGPTYEIKMKAMITGWRRVWGQGDFPFYFVQLTNEGKPVENPMDEEHFRYVPVREAQRRALSLPNTGMVVAIDLGEDANGHPRNKKDVGERLALWALAKTYNIDVPYTGPLYRDYRVDSDRIIISFDHVGHGLMIGDKDGLQPVRELPNEAMKQFSIAGADGKWRWANAKIVGETVVVHSDQVPKPVAVRYAYSLNPKGPKLYNREGLPASPFRTDPW